MKRTIVLFALCVAALTAAKVSAQQGLQTANGTTSILNKGYSSLSFDAKDASLGLVYATDKSGIPREWANNLLLSLSAEKGKRALFARGEWVPGVHLEDRLAFAFNDTARGAFIAPYVTAGLDVARRYLASTPAPVTNRITFDTATTWSRFVGLGLNIQRSPTAAVFGLAAKFSSDRAVPTAKRTKQVCVIQASGVNAKGNTVTASDCADRYVGGTTNRNSGQVRIDIVSPHWWTVPANARRESHDADIAEAAAQAELDLRNAALSAEKKRYVEDSARAAAALRTLIAAPNRADAIREWATANTIANSSAARLAVAAHDASDSKAERQRTHDAAKAARKAVNNVPTFSLIGAASTDFADHSKPAYNFALGPAIHTPLDFRKVIAAVMFEMDDAFNSAGDTPKVWDRFALRLYIGVPF